MPTYRRKRGVRALDRAGSPDTVRDAKKIARCRRKFLRNFPGGFHGEKFVDWERDYKWQAHLLWRKQLGRSTFEALLEDEAYEEIAQRAARIEGKTNLLFSFEKMALRDAVKVPEGARAFALGLHAILHGKGALAGRFDEWVRIVSALPRRQTRVCTWPVVTVFLFLAQPRRHLYLKPTVTKIAAKKYGYDFSYVSRPDFTTYASLIGFADQIREDLADLEPRDMIDIQSFIWVQGSEEY